MLASFATRRLRFRGPVGHLPSNVTRRLYSLRSRVRNNTLNNVSVALQARASAVACRSSKCCPDTTTVCVQSKIGSSLYNATTHTSCVVQSPSVPVSRSYRLPSHTVLQSQKQQRVFLSRSFRAPVQARSSITGTVCV
jgi:hypothetical protein